LRGLALEYLDSVLPPSLHRMQSIFETVTITAPAAVGAKDVAARLMDARQSVSLLLSNVASPTLPENAPKQT